MIDRHEARRLSGCPAVLIGLVRRALLTVGVRADRLGRRTIDPIVKAVCDQDGSRRAFELSDRVRVVVSKRAVWMKREPSVPQ